jgi:hypothetical protein
LSENFEFLVHNEESLLILCFIAFIFFAYSFLSVGFYDDFQKRVFDLEQQLVLVAGSKFNVLLSNFNELFLRKDLVLRFQFILGLLRSGIRLDYSVFSSNVTFFFNFYYFFILNFFIYFIFCFLCIVFFANLIIFIPFFLDEKILVKVFI